ncbi:hypothetical protein SUGI_0585710 [Cryptomeria japonica]|uniref:uncharacterized protein LOC131079403 isoform X1 n=1 Tax=Cryptomeria japonica TaxID=3369 RepID=UPI002414ACF9|nr:uncharacterized protein LOC131079403 isoform X1 [Cryptomeria japonica]GLJ29697.1 hypothetical protein SUGI_0585710 [Cryptomeria japonica]
MECLDSDAHSPDCPPNASEPNSSPLELHDSLFDVGDPRLPSCSFDSSSISLGLPWDSQGFALGIETGEFETQGLSLPSEPPELDLRDWILRHRIEPPHKNSLNEKLGDSYSQLDNTRFKGPPAQIQKDVKEISVFSRKNWDALLFSIDDDDENKEELYLASTLKKQRTNNQSLSARKIKDVEATTEALILDAVFDQQKMKEESHQRNKENLMFPALQCCEVEDTIHPTSAKENVVDPGMETEDTVAPDSETQGAVDPEYETEDAVDPNSGTNNAVNPDSDTEDESEHNKVESVKKFPSFPRLFISDTRLAKNESSFQEELAPLPSSRTQSFSIDEFTKPLSDSKKFQAISDIGPEEKENLFQTDLASMASFRTRISSRGGLRKALADTGNIQSQHPADKWLCPRTHKPHFKPPAKQLSLDRWLAPAK